MKCIDKKRRRCVLLILSCFLLGGCIPKADPVVSTYEAKAYNKSLYEGELYASNLCVSKDDVSIENFAGDSSLHAAALMDVTNGTVDYAYHMHDQLYPASTTKILTALVTMNRCNLDDIVTISQSAAASSFGIEDQVCGLQAGDQLTLRALLYGMLLYSGNDNATAIAEYVGGSIEGFAALMNEQAQSLHATNTNFVTPNGLHDENHYTTAYDLYLIFNECIKHQEFLDIISAPSYTADITGADGTLRQVVWEPTSYYARGVAALPEGATVIGGKTGYTGQAGNCLILLDQDETGNSYISIVMGAESKDLLYSDMSELINQIPNVK